ncbi:16S rRNA (cytidine(1402)-2'-O)-methyltransferase [Methylopila henanensis]|uniref:Ribosomal RNA small subunit methyltransferase I n=1 Tax=Methylopila henanensis TaxID=873516 RepID=A0ABW4K9A4_9HYPH
MPRVARPGSAPDASDAAEPDRARGYLVAGARLVAPPLAPGLHIVATPIGTLADITLRALETLAAADAVLCEDTRVTAKLMSHYGIGARLIAYHEHNASEMRPKVLARLAAGERLALVSDAGTPLISDPGFKLVRDCAAEGLHVTHLPGPSAVLTALVLAGLPTDRFFFEGFLPPKQAARRARIAEIARVPGTLVLFETGPRVAEALADLAEGLGPRPAALARELTKRFEQVRRASLPELAGALASGPDPKGEIVLVIGPPEEEAPLEGGELDALLAAALARVSLKDAVAEVAAATGLKRREVYARALELAQTAG